MPEALESSKVDLRYTFFTAKSCTIMPLKYCQTVKQKLTLYYLLVQKYLIKNKRLYWIGLLKDWNQDCSLWTTRWISLPFIVMYIYFVQLYCGSTGTQ